LYFLDSVYLAKVGVEGPNPFARSSVAQAEFSPPFPGPLKSPTPAGSCATAFETTTLGVDLEQPVNGLGFEPGGLRHPLGGSTSWRVPVVRLTEVFRQAAQSRIITSAHRINLGSIPDLSRPDGDSDFYFVQADDPEIAVPRIVELVKTRIPSVSVSIPSGTSRCCVQ
jgi:hypothetical protein